MFPSPYSWSSRGSAVSGSGYESASKDFVSHDLEVQVPGIVFLVTGGNSGIGKASALEIAKRDKQLLTRVSTEPHGQTVAGPHGGGYPVSQAGQEVLDDDPVVLGTAASFLSFELEVAKATGALSSTLN